MPGLLFLRKSYAVNCARPATIKLRQNFIVPGIHSYRLLLNKSCVPNWRIAVSNMLNIEVEPMMRKSLIIMTLFGLTITPLHADVRSEERRVGQQRRPHRARWYDDSQTLLTQ